MLYTKPRRCSGLASPLNFISSNAVSAVPAVPADPDAIFDRPAGHLAAGHARRKDRRLVHAGGAPHTCLELFPIKSGRLPPHPRWLCDRSASKANSRKPKRSRQRISRSRYACRSRSSRNTAFRSFPRTITW